MTRRNHELHNTVARTKRARTTKRSEGRRLLTSTCIGVACRRRAKEEIIRDFKSSASKGFIFGNDFVDVSTVGDVSLCGYLRELDKKLGRIAEGSLDDVQHRWITTLCAWFEDGPDGLARLCEDVPDCDLYRGMSISVLSANRSEANLAGIAALLPRKFTLPKSPNAFQTISGWCRDLASMLTLGKPLTIDACSESRLRAFIHKFLKKGIAPTRRIDRAAIKAPNRVFPLMGDIFYFGPGLTVLQFVGDETSIKLLQNFPDWSDEVRLRRAEVIAAIRKRVMANPNGRQRTRKRTAGRSATLRAKTEVQE